MRLMRGALPALLVPLAMLAIGIGLGFATFVDDRIVQGHAYGFRVGQPVAESLKVAEDMLEHGRIQEFRLGRGSAAILLESSSLDPTTEAHWKLVVDPSWWNNSISLRFEEQRLVEIHRFRLCCELP